MMIRQSMSRLFLPCAGSVALVVLTAACSPVGDGIGPVRLELNAPNGTANAATGRVFECIRTTVTATLFFSNGSSGDFSSRVDWSSSNPSVVRVSNGDEPATPPATGFFARGVLTPVTPGTSTITASYQGFTKSIDISVGTPTAITVRTVDSQSGLPSDPPGNSFRIGPGTTQDLSVTALLDNVETNIDGTATWAFVTPNDPVATINSASGLITGVAAGGPLEARASFPPCSMSASTTVNVAPILSISVVPEFGTANLFVGNSERIRVFADFGSGPEQNISLQSTLVSSNTTAGTFSGALGITNLLSGLAAGGPFDITATFPRTTPTFTSPAVSLSTVAGTLESITVTPASDSVVAGSATIRQFNAIGTYTGPITQDVTRLASWTSSDNTIAQISSVVTTSGQAFAFGRTPGVVTLTATVPLTTGTATATAQFTTTAAPP